MKTSIFLFLLIVISGCFKDKYVDPFAFLISKDNKPLTDAKIQVFFTYLDQNGKETFINISKSSENDSATIFGIYSTEDLKKFSFKPVKVLIKCDKLPETDTLEFLLDYDCGKRSKNCSCGNIDTKYVKCNSIVLPDLTIRK